MKKKFETTFSVVVPVFNEAGNIEKLTEEIRGTMQKLNKPFEIIFVDDGSTDDTPKVLKNNKNIKVITFRSNFGQSAALNAGIKMAQGEMVITMDGDGQNDPTDIPNLLAKLNEGYDVVCGWRFDRKDEFTKVFVSNVARKLRGMLVEDGVHDAGCTLRVFKRECFDDLELTGELHRMIPALLRWRGFKITEIKVNHRPRLNGKSKYGTSRMLKGFLDMLLIWFTRKYNSRPLHLFGGVGLILIILSSVLLLILAWMRVFQGFTLSDKIWPIVGLIGLVAGIQLFVFGILADLIIKNNTKSKAWMIKDVLEN